jgi:cation transport ATPase
MQSRMQTVEMQISGLSSGPVSSGVRSALECIHGVEQVRILPNEPYVTVTYDALMVRLGQFETAVRVMGCKVERLVERHFRAAGAHEGQGKNPEPSVDRANGE